MRRLLSISLLLLASASCFATTRYVAQSAGTFTGGTACNGQTAITPTTWNSLTLSAGDITYLCGTFTGTAGQTLLTIPSSGSSGNNIILRFDTGTALNAPYWGANGAIYCSGQQYITIDGQNTGSISNTANGTSLTYHQASNGVNAVNCPYVTVQNLTVSGIYINQGSSSGATDTNGLNTADINFAGTSTGVTITGNTVSSAKIGISVQPDPNLDASNVTIANNNISDMDWGVVVGGGDAGDTMTNIVISGNTITNWTNWQFPTSAYHQDGVILYNQGSSNIETVTLYNNYIYGDLGVGSPTGFIYCSTSTSCQLYNNLLVNTGHNIYGIAWINNPNCGNHVYNNTIVGLSGDFGVTIGNLTCPSSLGKMVLENNIVSGPGVGINDYGTLTSDVSVSNYNLFQNASGSAPSMVTNDGTYLTWATWQADGFDANSNNSSPNLNSSYKIASASGGAYQTATNLTSLGYSTLNTDKAGTVRPTTGAWDMGAYEYASGTTYTLTITATNGSVSGTNCSSGTYASGTSIGACTATPNTGYSFTGWSGTGSCSSVSGTGTASCTITANSTLTATFTINSYTLSTATSGTGSGTVSGCAGTLNYGAAYSCAVTPNTGSSLTSVSGCSGTGTTTYSGTMPASNCTVTATFALNTESLTITTSGAGSGTVSGTNCSTGTLNYGTSVTCTATASTGTFAGFTGTGSASSCSTSPCSFTITSTSTLNALFATPSTTITGVTLIGVSVQ